VGWRMSFSEGMIGCFGLGGVSVQAASLLLASKLGQLRSARDRRQLREPSASDFENRREGYDGTGCLGVDEADHSRERTSFVWRCGTVFSSLVRFTAWRAAKRRHDVISVVSRRRASPDLRGTLVDDHPHLPALWTFARTQNTI
jgi:hypothetical protein